MENTENYPLDEATIGVLAEIKKAQTDFEAQPVVQQVRQHTVAFESQRQGALLLFVRQQKLEGGWRVADNGRELVKDSAPAPAAAAVPEQSQ